jgi:hypothetical protein
MTTTILVMSISTVLMAIFFYLWLGMQKRDGAFYELRRSVDSIDRRMSRSVRPRIPAESLSLSVWHPSKIPPPPDIAESAPIAEASAGSTTSARSAALLRRNEMKTTDVIEWLNWALENNLAEGAAIDENGDWWVQEWEKTKDGLTILIGKYEEGIDDPVEKKMYQLSIKEGR